MSANMSDERVAKNIPTGTDAHDERVASREELYLETTEEKLRETLISEDLSTYPQQETVCADCCSVASLNQQLDHAAEELITGDSDDPPLSQEAVAEALRMTANSRRLDA